MAIPAKQGGGSERWSFIWSSESQVPAQHPFTMLTLLMIITMVIKPTIALNISRSYSTPGAMITPFHGLSPVYLHDS